MTGSKTFLPAHEHFRNRFDHETSVDDHDHRPGLENLETQLS
jgi:hypothetical protein